MLATPKVPTQAPMAGKVSQMIRWSVSSGASIRARNASTKTGTCSAIVKTKSPKTMRGAHVQESGVQQVSEGKARQGDEDHAT